MADKLSIATYFIMNSPPGEVRDVLRDVKIVVKDKKLLEPNTVSKILNDYNIKMLTPVKKEDGNFCITSTYGNVSGDQFVDPNSGAVLKFDSNKEKWASVSEKKEDLGSGIVDQRAKIQEVMNDYAEQHFKDNKGAPVVYANKDGVITICLSFRDLNLSNFWTGSWRGVYTLNVGSSGPTSLKGDIKATVHYYEDGNVQLHSSTNTESKVKVGSPEETASIVMETIKKIDHEFHEALEKMYLDMHRVTFKSLRRFLPCNRQRMNWNIAVHNVNENLAGAQE